MKYLLERKETRTLIVSDPEDVRMLRILAGMNLSIPKAMRELDLHTPEQIAEVEAFLPRLKSVLDAPEVVGS